MRILFDSKKLEYKSPFGALKTSELCNISIKIPTTVEVINCYLILKSEDGLETRVHLQQCSTFDNYNKFSGSFSLEIAGLYLYYFLIEKPNSSFKLYKFGQNDTNIEEGGLWQITCYPSDFSINNDFKNKIMYQIFPDRFYKYGDVNLIEKDTPYILHNSLDDIPDYKENKEYNLWNIDFFGGNLNGIKEKIPYLKELGINILYLNPICKSLSNHRYDASDFKKVDPILGNEEDFKKLCNELHKSNIKIILDGVFSHTGSDSIYFDKYYRYGNGAVSNPENSPYKSWYNFYEFPNKYESWWGIRSLPCVNELNPSYIDYIITGENSVVKYWMNLGADGFRLDVVDEIPDEFLSKFRNEVKRINPNSIIIGEVWEDASNKESYGKIRHYFDNEIDTTMNYPFRKAIIELCKNELSFYDFYYSILTILENYPKDSINCLMNSLSTHDTLRILNAFSNYFPSSKDEKAHFTMSDSDKASAFNKLKLALIVQFILPGNPCIYYGDEIGMEGFEDPFNRAYFKWNNFDMDINNYYKEIIKLYKESISKLPLFDIEYTNNELILYRYSKYKTIKLVLSNIDNDTNEKAQKLGDITFSNEIKLYWKLYC